MLYQSVPIKQCVRSSFIIGAGTGGITFLATLLRMNANSTVPRNELYEYRGRVLRCTEADTTHVNDHRLV